MTVKFINPEGRINVAELTLEGIEKLKQLGYQIIEPLCPKK